MFFPNNFTRSSQVSVRKIHAIKCLFKGSVKDTLFEAANGNNSS